MKRNSKFTAAMLLLVAAAAVGGDRRVHLLPKLQSGQKLTYVISDRSETDEKTESRVVTPMIPGASRSSVQVLLRAKVLKVQAGSALARIRATLESLDSVANFATNGATPQVSDSKSSSAKTKSVEFVIQPDGRVDQVTGLYAFSAEEQQAWQQWISRFAAPWTFPPAGVRFGDTWKSQQAELAPSPIAELSWVRESTYVRNEPCRASQLSLTGEVSASSGPTETCAVLLTKATLRQKSSPKDATPEDYRLHELKTMGTAKGANEVITYISLTTGLVVRATEEASQQMDVVVAKADGSNRVRYKVNAKSSSQVLLITGAP